MEEQLQNLIAEYFEVIIQQPPTEEPDAPVDLPDRAHELETEILNLLGPEHPFRDESDVADYLTDIFTNRTRLNPDDIRLRNSKIRNPITRYSFDFQLIQSNPTGIKLKTRDDSISLDFAHIHGSYTHIFIGQVEGFSTKNALENAEKLIWEFFGAMCAMSCSFVNAFSRQRRTPLKINMKRPDPIQNSEEVYVESSLVGMLNRLIIQGRITEEQISQYVSSDTAPKLVDWWQKRRMREENDMILDDENQNVEFDKMYNELFTTLSELVNLNRYTAIIDVFSTQSERAFEIRNACLLFLKGEVCSDYGEALLYFFMALESILLDRENTNNVQARLIEAIAYRMGRNDKSRKELRKKIKQLYNDRSLYVHTGRVRARRGCHSELSTIAKYIIAMEIKEFQL